MDRLSQKTRIFSIPQGMDRLSQFGRQNSKIIRICDVSSLLTVIFCPYLCDFLSLMFKIVNNLKSICDNQSIV